MMHLGARMFAFAALVLLTIVPFALAHADHGEHESKDQDIDATFTIAGFQMAELNLAAEAGEQIVWSVSTDADTPPYVDVHTHNENGTVAFFADNGNHSIEETFVIPEDGEYSIMVRNEQTAEAEFTLTTEGHFALLSTHGFTVEQEHGETPSLPMVLAVGGLAVLALAVAWTRR